jgi:hypothetical protein
LLIARNATKSAQVFVDFSKCGCILKNPHNGLKKQVVVSKTFDNNDFGYNKITVEHPLRLNFQASAERIALLDDLRAF